MGWPWSKDKKDNADSSKTAPVRKPSKLEHRHKNHEFPHKDRDSTTKPAKIRSCLACADDLPAHEMMRLACSHYYCTSCTTRMFNLATSQESSYPPKCCSRISLTSARDYLDRDTRKRYEKKRIEWDTSTKKRVYCSRKGCNAFIPPESIDKKRARCLECGGSTCLGCKGPEHQGRPCSDNEALKATLKTLERKGWKRCPECGEGIEKIDGCQHVQCNCGREFCYQCGAPWAGDTWCPCRGARGSPLVGGPIQMIGEDIGMGMYNGGFPIAGIGRGRDARRRGPVLFGSPLGPQRRMVDPGRMNLMHRPRPFT